MKTNVLTARCERFIRSHSADREERIRFIVFFTGALQLTIFTLLNIVGAIGIRHHFLQAVAFALLALCISMVVFYLRRTLTLIQAFSVFAISAQLLEMARIGFLALAKPQGYEAMIIYYQIGSYTILLYLTLGFVPKTPFISTALSIATLAFTTFYYHAAIDIQITILFTLLSLFTCALAHISQRGMQGIQQENKNYQATHNSILKAFNMRQSELIAYLQLCRTKEPDSKNIDLLLNQLDEQSKHNLIHAAMALKKKREAQQLVLSKSFPSLSHTELEVGRLVVEGKTLSEIAVIMGKSTTNISTVRGNIRKKLNLLPNENLEEKLKELAMPMVKMTAISF
jgi:hypothetical protein